MPASAAGQIGVVASAYSDQRFRGYSLSDGRPVGIVDVSYDGSNGLYASMSGSLVATRHDGPEVLGLVLNGGYAARIRPGLTFDLGAIHSRYSHYSGLAGTRAYTEAYAGIAGNIVGARLSLSPNYFGPAHWTSHVEINGHFDLGPTLLIDGTLGILAPLDSRGYRGRHRPQWDARLGLTKRLGTTLFHAAITSHASPSQNYVRRRHSRTALILGISSAL